MRKSTPFRLRAACRQKYNEEPETCLPRLIRQLSTPQRVAGDLEVAANSVRSWLMQRGWVFDGVEWVLQQEAERA